MGRCDSRAHIGRLGEYAEMAAAKEMASIIVANTHGGARGWLRWVASVRDWEPIRCAWACHERAAARSCSTSNERDGRRQVRVKHIAGQPIPLGWVLDPDGKPTTNPAMLYGDPPGTILPMGGDQAYKGFGLSFLIGCFAEDCPEVRVSARIRRRRWGTKRSSS